MNQSTYTVMKNGRKAELHSYPMMYDGESWESVDLEPDPGYALYRDIGNTIREYGNDINVVLQSADRYTDPQN